MQSESPRQPEQTCQWCGGIIPANSSSCADCGATRPREDLVAPGFTPPASSAISPESNVEPADEDEVRAQQIMKDLNAYIPEETPPPRTGVSEPGEDVLIIIGALLAAGLVGGLFGWFIAPTFLHELFQDMIGVDSDGPDAFRRLGAFFGALIAMLFGALVATILRR